MPTALKQMLGEKDINRQEPRPTEVKATPPRSLTDKAARKLYKTLATELVKFGLLTKIDVQDLADACQLWANADTLYAEYLKEPWKKSSVRGDEINPALRASLAQRAEARKVFRGFGIGSPAERSRLKVVEPVKKKSKFSGLITPSSN